MGETDWATRATDTISPRAATALRETDDMPPELRGCVHEYGYAIVAAFRQAGVTQARHIHHIVREMWFGARQPQQRLGNAKRRPLAYDHVDWLLAQSGSSLSAEGLVRALHANHLVIVPIEPTNGMVEASMEAIRSMGLLSKEKKHRVRLRAAIRAAITQFWPTLAAPPPAPSPFRLTTPGKQDTAA